MIMTEAGVFPFLSGGGEMGKLMREKDWQFSAVGEPSGWPQSLRTSLYIVLNAKFPMFLWWGKQLICFYNDAYRPSLGQHGKHPGILGMPAEQAWTEIWDVIKPLIDQVLQGQSTFSEDQLIPIFRNNQLEDVYWTFSYSPVMGEHNRPEGVLVTCQETTEKVRSLKELREREEQLLFTIEAADLGTWDLNPATNTFKGNDRLKGWFGLGPDEQIELSTAINSIAETDRQRVVEAIQYALNPRSGGHYEIEYGIINPKTSIEIKVLARGKALFGEDGKAYRFSGTMQDLSEEKKAYEKLHKNEERLNLVIEASELGIWEWQPGIDQMIYSNRYLEIFGMDPNIQVAHEEMLAMIHPEDRSIRDTAIQDAFHSGILHYEVRLIWKDGSIHWVEAKGRVYLDHKQQPNKAIGTLRDITQEKHSRNELITSEKKFRLLADSMAQFVWTADPLGNLTYFNQAVYQFGGLSTDALGEQVWMQIVHPEEQEKNNTLWLESIRTGRPFYYEHRFRRHDGVYRWQMSRAVPQKDDEGQIQMWVGTSTDIEDQKIFAGELERQVRERTNELIIKNRELNKMNAELESFAYVSSHDLQEPLRKIQIFASKIEEDELHVLSEKTKHYFERIQASANRMQVLIEDLLAYSRLGATRSVFTNTDLSEIVVDTIAELKEKINLKQAVVEVGPLCSLMVIPYQMHQLMTNLITNSLKFSRPGIAPIIQIAASVKDGSCHIRFSDNGIGFEEQYQDKIFEVFQRLHNKPDYEGTGIGLSIVKKIIENHNGTIRATSRPGQGATFDIFIPTNLAVHL
jgi:PAS domain S-box-containing protein